MSEQQNTPEIQMDAQGMCREEVFTDNKIGTLRKLSPVTTSGADDSSRAVQFIGSTQIMTPGGALPLNFEIPAENLEDAISGFGDAAQQAVEQTMEELREMQRKQASSIVVPGGGVDPGAMAGGKIQIP